MKHFSQRIAAGLAGLVAAHLPVHAGDMMNGAAGGIKDYGSAGIAVPAPVPYEETFKWYVRGDIGTAFKNSGKFETGGLTAPQITQPGDWSEQSIVSFGFGRYLTPSVRGEITLDYRTPKSIASGVRALPDISITRAVPGISASLNLNERLD